VAFAESKMTASGNSKIGSGSDFIGKVKLSLYLTKHHAMKAY
jgi:hypothetical protein